MKTLILVIFATFTASAYSDHHESTPMSTDGAFTTLQVAAPDIAKYRQTLIDNPSAFKATGTTAAGICVTNSGQDYVGQMMVWNAFPNVAAALAASTKYDPQQAPESYSNLREIKYGVTWKPVTPFRLEPGYERVQRIKVSSENMSAFLEAVNDLEKAIIKAGHPNFYNGAFVLIGGGERDVGTVILRSIVRDGNAMGSYLTNILRATLVGKMNGQKWFPWARSSQTIWKFVSSFISVINRHETLGCQTAS